jgi:protein-disulfide isomerase
MVKEPEAPKLAVNTEGYPSWGNAKAPVTVIEFSDFQCPFCSRAVPTIDRIKKEFGPDKVRIVFRDMPLPNHNRALPASLAARCANEQGKFWEMHNTLFENQQKLEDKDLKEYAKTVGLDVAKFNECFDGKKYVADLEKSRSEAEKIGIAATPSFLINGVLLQGAQPFEKFKEKIDRAAKHG